MNRRFTPIFRFLIIAAVLLSPALYQSARIAHFGHQIIYSMQPFERSNPGAHLKVLFLGDSTIVGTGAHSANETTAGWFGQEFPHANIVNISRNGLRLEGLLYGLRQRQFDHYDLIIVQIGANDIMHFTPLAKVKAQINEVVDHLKPAAGTMVILHSGNIGLAPIFSWPFDALFAWRSRQVRQIYRETARERGVLYVDLYAERSNDLFLKDIGLYYSADYLHPSGEGYRFWYSRIRDTLDAAGVRLSE